MSCPFRSAPKAATQGLRQLNNASSNAKLRDAPFASDSARDVQLEFSCPSDKSASASDTDSPRKKHSPHKRPATIKAASSAQIQAVVPLTRVFAPALKRHIIERTPAPDEPMDDVSAHRYATIHRRTLSVYYENEHTGLFIVHKPSNLLIDGSEHSVEAFLQRMYPHYKFHLVHQIDYATSGILLLALSQKAAAGISRLFRTRVIKKLYVAVVRGWVDSDTMTIEFPIDEDKDSGTRHRMRVGDLSRSGCVFEPASTAEGGEAQCKKKKNTAKSARTVLHVVRRGYLSPTSSTCSQCAYSRAEMSGALARLSQARRPPSQRTEDGGVVVDNEGSALASEYIELRRTLEIAAMKSFGPATVEGGEGCPCCAILDAEYGTGKPSLSENKGEKVTLVHLELHTGRRHQLRVHLSAIGHPIVGDPLYESEPPAGVEVQQKCPYSSSSSSSSSKEKKDDDCHNVYSETARHRMLLHSEYMLLPLHLASTKVGAWGNMDLSINVPSGFESLVSCRCEELRSPECGCSDVEHAATRCVTSWEIEREAQPGVGLNELHRMNMQVMNRQERDDRFRQHASYLNCASSLSQVYSSIMDEQN